MIEVKGLYKSFDDKTVLSDINASFENGKTNLIIGQSGSGKTVLMKCIVGLLTPEKGEVLYDGRNLVLMGKKEKKMLRKEMGMIFQSAALFDSMTAVPRIGLIRQHDGVGKCHVPAGYVLKRHLKRPPETCPVLSGSCESGGSER